MKSLILAITCFIVAISDQLILPNTALAETITKPACQIDDPPSNCSQGNMWATAIDNEIPKGLYTYTPTPTCINGVSNGVANILAAAAAASDPTTAMFAGPITDAIAGPINSYVDENVRGDLGRIFNSHGDATARCANLALSIPAKASVVGYRLEMTDNWEGWKWQRCHVGDDCGQGWCKFPTSPSVSGNDAIQIATVQFMNWSDDRPRHARMWVFYQMPAGKKPIVEM